MGKTYRKKPKRLKQGVAVMSKDRLKLYRKTQSQIDRVNKRMLALDKGGYAGTWSAKRFLNRIYGEKISNNVTVVTKRGKPVGIKLKPKVTNTQLIAINKASQQFLVSKTSTVKGIKEVRKETISTLKVSLSEEGKELTDEDVEFLYDMLELQEMQDLVESFGASTIWAVSQDAIEKGDSEEQFLDRFERQIADLNDEDMKRKAKRLYEYLSSK